MLCRNNHSPEHAEHAPNSPEPGSVSSQTWAGGVEEVVVEMDKLNAQETRDILIAFLFVLKHLETGMCGSAEAMLEALMI